MAPHGAGSQVVRAKRIADVLSSRHDGGATGWIKQRCEPDGKLARRSGGVRQTDPDQPACTLRIVGDSAPAVAVVHCNCFLVVIGGLGIRRPSPSVATDLAAIVEIIQKPESKRQAVMVGRDSL